MIDKGNNEELEYLLTYHFLYLGSLNFYKYKKYKHIDRIASEMKHYFPNWKKNKLVKLNFNKKELVYLKLFYYSAIAISSLMMILAYFLYANEVLMVPCIISPYIPESMTPATSVRPAV